MAQFAHAVGHGHQAQGAAPQHLTPREKEALMNDVNRHDDLITAYGTECHAKFVEIAHTDDVCLVDYEPLKLSTVRIFCSLQGTVVTDGILHVEQFMLIILFFACAFPIHYCFHSDIGAAKGMYSVGSFIREQENKMRQFAGIMTSLTIFLLSFYTSIVVGRWWVMRTKGVGAIKAATVDLEMLLQQCVTKDERVLSAVRRYGRTSLLLIFMWRRKQLGNLKEMLMRRKLLTEEECDLLPKWGHCYHETIWAWQAAIINKLNDQGKITSDELFRMLIEKCTDGRAAVQVCHTHLAVRVPMQYVHILGLLVKMHNFVICVIMGILFGAALEQGMVILCLQLFLRICILPLLFNAILIINCNLADPFDGSETDFPGEIYQQNLDKDCVGVMGACEHIPDWLKEMA